MLIRIRCKDGNFRLEFQQNASMAEFEAKLVEKLTNPDVSTITISNQPVGNEAALSPLKDRTIHDIGLRHGDLVFVTYKEREGGTSSPTTSVQPVETQPSTSQAGEPSKRVWESVVEDPVDVYWRGQSGKIPRGRDSRFCKHGANGMCDYCMPLEPYDADYHKNNSIKHLSFHAYLQKISPKSTLSATSSLPPLEPLNYKVKVPCPTGSHPSWPAGICTSCQPSAITLNPQPFRMVDHLEIASMEVIERFLQIWRQTALQRFGWLIGRYEPYDKVPMGVKAVVEAIYEPPQHGDVDGLTLGLPWEDEERIKHLAASASSPLTIVGYIFTDLNPTDEDRTKNIYKRHPGSFFLSSLEAIFAARLQKDAPVPSRSSYSGQFGSRLVTAVLTATEDGQIDISAYQVSEQAVAMVDADMIEASVDPGIVRVKEEDRSEASARYIPDVFYTYKNEYGLEVKKSAKPCFPVEYLIVNVTHGFPQNPSPMFQSTRFAIENRPGVEDQRIESVLSSLNSLGAPDMEDSRIAPPGTAHKRLEFAKWLSDWHLISFLETTQLISPDDIKLIIRTVTSPNISSDSSAIDPVLNCDSWQTLVTFARETAPSRPSGPTPASSSNYMDEDIPQEIYDQIAAEQAGGAGKTCPHCTFENEPGRADCDVCGLPLSG